MRGRLRVCPAPPVVKYLFLVVRIGNNLGYFERVNPSDISLVIATQEDSKEYLAVNQ